MSIQDLIDNGSIKFNESENDTNAISSANRAFTILTLEALYGDPASGTGSSSFRALFNNAGDLPLTIGFLADGGQASIPTNTVNIDPNYDFLFVDQNGTIQKADFQRILAHEIHHALANDVDTTRVLDGSISVTGAQYRGDTVTATNTIMFEIGVLSERLAYSDAFTAANLSALGGLGDNLTQGNAVDIVLSSSATTVDPISGSTLPGQNLITYRNIDETRDLLIAGSMANSLLSGLGNDFLYAGAGSDILNGGAGDDYLNGGTGLDYADYQSFLAQAGGIAPNGIVVNWSSSELTVLDGFNNFDTLIDIELVFGSHLSDEYVLSGNLSAIFTGAGSLDTQLNADGFEQEIAQEDGVIDVLNLEDVSSSSESGVVVSFTTSRSGFITSGARIEFAGFERIIASKNDNDTIDFSGISSAGVTVDLSAQGENGVAVPLPDGNSIIIQNFEHVIGSVSNDTINGSEAVNSIDGRAGNDTIEGGAGEDDILGGSGNDILTDSGTSDVDSIWGGTGNDTITVNGGNDILFGGANDDTLRAIGEGSAQLFGGSGNDTLYGNGSSTLDGGTGADTIYAQTGDTVGRLTAEDTLYVDGVPITGNLLDRSVVWADNLIFGVPSPEGSNFFWGNLNDFGQFQTRTGVTRDSSEYDFAVFFKLNGTGSDFNGTYQSVSYTLYIVPNPALNGIILEGWDGGSDIPDVGLYSVSQIESVSLIINDFRPGDFGFMNQEEMEPINTDDGGFDSNPNFIYDSLFSSLGSDQYLNGTFLTLGDLLDHTDEYIQAEKDRELIEAAEEAIRENPEDADDSPTDGDDVSVVNNLMLTSSFGAGDDIVVASAFDDSVSGDAGADLLQGDLGNDSLFGGSGDDRLYGGSTRIDDQELVGATEIETELAYTVVSFFEIEINGQTYPGVDGGVVYEGQFYAIDMEQPTGFITVTETIPAVEIDDGADFLDGGTGVDRIYGGDGADTVYGGADSDFLYGGSGADSVSGDDGQDLLFGGEGDDTLFGGSDNDMLFGTGGNDSLYGGAGIDALYGGTGTNFISSGEGDDNIFGGGENSYSFIDGDGNDTILNFDVTSDTIVINGIEINPHAPPVGVTISQDPNDVFLLVISYGDGDTILLEQTTLFFWQLNTEPPLPIDNTVSGTDENDVIGVGYTDLDGDTIVDGYEQFTVDGGAGDDNITFLRSTDSEFYGGDGNDTINVKFSSGATFYGGGGNDRLFLGLRENEAFGGAGDDLISGALSHGSGHTMSGGEGADSFVFSNAGTAATASFIRDFEVGVDSLTIDGRILNAMHINQIPAEFQYTHNSDGDLVISFQGTADDFVHTIELDGVTAGDFFLEELIGQRTWDGTAGDDTMGIGYTDADGDVITDEYSEFFVYGGDGNDNINFLRSVDSEFYGGDGNDTINVKYSSGAIYYGGAGDDRLFLYMRENEAYGGAGDDLIVGALSHGSGHTMTGDEGADHFVFNSIKQKATESLITDFEVGVDRLTVGGHELNLLQLDALPAGFQHSHNDDGDLVISFQGTATDYVHSIELGGVTADQFFMV